MTHKTGFLSGDEPQEIEEKTEAQKIDERRPAAMAASRSMFDLAEMDDRPAIEQKTASQEIISERKENNRPQFQIDASFEKEMKEREAKERAESIKRQAEQKREEQAAAEARQKVIEEKLRQPQTLDEAELRAEIAEETHVENEEKLYPDAKSLEADIEDELWRRRTDNGKQIAGRAKIEDVYDTKLSHTIFFALAMQLAGIVIAAIAFSSGLRATNTITAIVVSATIISASAFFLVLQGNKCRKHTVASNQHKQFMLATVIPGMMLRLLLIGLFSLVPITGSLVGCVIGTAIGASIHYLILNRYGIYVSITTTLLHSALYVIVLAFEVIWGLFSLESFAAIFLIAYMIEFVLGDLTAMKLALLTDK